VKKLGFRLGKDEIDKAFAQFKMLSDKKKYVFDEDIEAILEDQIGHVPETWKLIYLKALCESGKKPSAEIKLSYLGHVHEAKAEGDGPVDASYKAVESIVRSGARVAHYGIQSVTGGMDAQGEVAVKLLVDGRELTGRGMSTDIIEASVKAYLFAINKFSAHVTPRISAQHSPV
jgi:2-isopropylmalate synthase